MASTERKAKRKRPPQEELDSKRVRRSPDAARPTGTRRALSHVGGPISDLVGPEPLQKLLRYSLNVSAERRPHVHAFHSYPARLHPETAERLIAGLCEPRAHVLDPFCGSGTVVVEARRLGRRATGIDINPLAVELTRFKTGRFDARALRAATKRIVEGAEQRRKKKVGASRRFSEDEIEQFDPHVLMELDGLKALIDAERSAETRRSLLLVLSSILTKVSRRAGDSSTRQQPKRIASGFTIRFFDSRLNEVLEQMRTYSRLVPRDAPAVRCLTGDARKLSKVVKIKADLVLTSPPYPGVLDYVDHHRTRIQWLGAKLGEFEHGEIGARRQLSRLSYEAAAERWEREFSQVLREITKVLAPAGHVALVAADSMLGDRPYFANEMIRTCASVAGLSVLASAAQVRPHFHRKSAAVFGRRPRKEHSIILARR